MEKEQFKNEKGEYRVKGDEIIGDLIKVFPKAAPVMMSFGLHCVGCAANSYDTVRNGAKLHGMEDETIDQMISEINKSINKVVELLEFTPNAIKKVKELREEESDKKDWPLRIIISQGGCAGFNYDMDFANDQTDNDMVFEFDDLTVLVDKDSFKMLKGSSIDFVDSLMGSGFKIDNPNASNSCGCGNS